MPRPPTEKLHQDRVGVPGAARFLGRTENYVRRKADSGELPSVRDANDCRIFLVKDLETFAIRQAAVQAKCEACDE